MEELTSPAHLLTLALEMVVAWLPELGYQSKTQSSFSSILQVFMALVAS